MLRINIQLSRSKVNVIIMCHLFQTLLFYVAVNYWTNDPCFASVFKLPKKLQTWYVDIPWWVNDPYWYSGQYVKGYVGFVKRITQERFGEGPNNIVKTYAQYNFREKLKLNMYESTKNALF